MDSTKPDRQANISRYISPLGSKISHDNIMALPCRDSRKLPARRLSTFHHSKPMYVSGIWYTSQKLRPFIPKQIFIHIELVLLFLCCFIYIIHKYMYSYNKYMIIVAITETRHASVYTYEYVKQNIRLNQLKIVAIVSHMALCSVIMIISTCDSDRWHMLFLLLV